MPKQLIGTMKHKRLIEGDENLLEVGEVLLVEDKNFSYILKERNEEGTLNVSVVMPMEDYLKYVDKSYNEGIDAAKKAYLEYETEA